MTKSLQRAAELAFVGPAIEIALGDVELRVREQQLAAVVDHAADVIDVGVREHHCVDVLRLDAGLRHALLLAAGGRPERLRGAHAGVEQHELFAGVDDRRVLFEHDVVGRQEVISQHLVDFFFRRADEGALGRGERQRAVRDDGHLGIAEVEAVEIGRLRPDLGGAREYATAEHARCAETGAEREQGPSRNMGCHACSSTDFMKLFFAARVDRSAW